MIDYRQLPVYRHRETIISALKDNQVIIVESPTGSGKTLTLPLILHEAGYCDQGLVGVTQPRRIAAFSITDFMQEQLENGHDLVSVKMRFLDRTTSKTRIKVMTDGILLQEIKHDPMLKSYSVLLIDEAHERSLNIDFILGMVKTILKSRPDFRLIISSATINTDTFREYFSGSKIIHIETPVFPVEEVYHPVVRTGDDEILIKTVAQIVGEIHQKKSPGDILIFVSGEFMIKNCISAFLALECATELQIMPLYGRLSHEEQKAVFPPALEGKRKVVVSTNIAETSVTIDGIAFVIDTGFFKQNFYNPVTFTEALVEGPVSKASANQRRGRAGRTRPGVCYRLYSQEDFESRPLYTEEEIFRTDLSEVVLRMADLGIRDFENFDFISQPGRQNISGAVETLNILDALNPDRSLSKIGSFMAEFPLLPRLSRALAEAVYHYPDAVAQTITAISFLSTNSPYLLPQGEELEARAAHHSFRHKKGDFVSYLNLHGAFVAAKDKEVFCKRYYMDLKTLNEIVSIKRQLEEMVSERGIPVIESGTLEDMLCAISRGLIQFVCSKSTRGMYKSLTASNIQIHPGSVMFREEPEFIVAGEVVKTSRTYARSVSPLTKELIQRIHPTLLGRLSGVRSRSDEFAQKPTDILVIGKESFRITPLQGKKRLVVLPWEKLEKVKDHIPSLPFNVVQGLRGTVIYDSTIVLDEEKLKTIFKIIPFLDLTRDFRPEKAAKSRNYQVDKDITEICEVMDRLLQPVRSKKKKKATEFITLYAGNEGRYWLKGTLNFHTAISQSMASLEALIDEGAALMNQAQKDKLAALYRKMAAFYEE